METNFRKYLGEIAQYMQDCGINVYPYPKVKLNNQPQNSDDSLHDLTGYYNPSTNMIVLYTYGRHPKDVLRSYAHEMIHHSQNLDGQMTPDKMGESGDPKYAQNNSHLRELEEDAYKRGNMLFRDYCDNKKYGK